MSASRDLAQKISVPATAPPAAQAQAVAQLAAQTGSVTPADDVQKDRNQREAQLFAIVAGAAT
eukprot:9142609-Alexandrium_andersonii.AAC.1